MLHVLQLNLVSFVVDLYWSSDDHICDRKKLKLRFSPPSSLPLTFPVKSLLQAANPHRGRVILTNLATVPGYQ
ncbi:hypothetical protein, partial [Nostoc sp.]|uniref:hypothetical protein n=1 Tax=Nostoc sp. TaxID=1180 RepID=UPI002FF5F04A